jgi:hypothetical protein
LIGVTPPVAYPIVFWITLLATLLVGRAARRSTGAAPVPVISDAPMSA